MNQNNPTLLNTLLVSTDKNLCDSLRRLTGELRHYRCQIEWKKTRRTALKALQNGDYDVCFIEYDFTKKADLLSLSEAVTVGCHAPLILLTGEKGEAAHLEAMRQGATYCLSTETLDAPLLETAIGYAVEHFGSWSELRENVSKFRNLVETLPVMIYIAEPQPPYSAIYISQAFEAFGFSLEKWNDGTDFWVNLLHPEDRRRVLEKTEAAMRDGLENDFEYRVVAADGSVRWVQDRGHFIRDDKGEAVCWQGIILDITERKHAEKSLRDSEAQFKSAFEDAAVGMAMTSLDGRWIRVNQQLCDMLGYTKDELTDRHFTELTHPDDLQRDLDSKKRFMSGASRVYQCEKRYLHKNGTAVWSYLSSSLVRDENGEPTHFISEMQNVSDRQQAVEALRESEARYRELFENANDLIYTRDIDG
ncbi:MAG: PAS domain S-box protein, partial [Acidobacteriota bacterium]|nr:PAS domain S-box protein [Acidobacteriota bacterium]